MDLKSYSQTYGTKEQSQPKPESTESGLNEKDIRRAINHFSKMPNDQLMRELGKHISAKKRQGREAEIYSTLERVKPFLNPEQRKRMEEVVKSFQ